MRSLKFKFTISITLVITFIVLLFAGIIFIVNVNNAGSRITNDAIENIKTRFPKINKAIEKNTDQIIDEIISEVRQDELKKFRNTLIVVLPAIILSSIIFSYLLASYLLKPIEDLAFKVSTINLRNLSTRVPEDYKSTEMDLLASTFNNMLDELEQAFKSQDQFIQDASHELKTPLAALKTTLQVFNEKSEYTESDYKSLIYTVNKINEKLIKLNNNLLFLNSKNKNVLNKVSLNDLIDDVIESVIFKANQKDIHIETNYQGNLLIMADTEKFSVAIKNIIENAIKYSKPQTKIQINTSLNKDIQIEIKDQGIGISQNDIDRIFDRFYRADNASQNNEEGEGLGLSIVKKIIEEHKGTISVESKLNIGTAFKIKLPNHPPIDQKITP